MAREKLNLSKNTYTNICSIINIVARLKFLFDKDSIIKQVAEFNFLDKLLLKEGPDRIEVVN